MANDTRSSSFINTLDLKRIVILSYLTDDMLEKIVPIIDILKYDEREAIFQEGDIAERFYMLRREKILPLMDSDPPLGYIISQRLTRVIKKRLDLRTEQFIRAIQNHPDLQSFF